MVWPLLGFWDDLAGWPRVHMWHAPKARGSFLLLEDVAVTQTSVDMADPGAPCFLQVTAGTWETQCALFDCRVARERSLGSHEAWTLRLEGPRARYSSSADADGVTFLP